MRPHDWSYQAGDSGSTIIATCARASYGCPIGTVTIELTAQQDLIYGNTENAVTVSQTPANSIANLTVMYSGTNGTVYAESITAPINVGTYKATLTLVENDNTATAEVTYTINKATPDVEFIPLTP